MNSSEFEKIFTAPMKREEAPAGTAPEEAITLDDKNFLCEEVAETSLQTELVINLTSLELSRVLRQAGLPAPPGEATAARLVEWIGEKDNRIESLTEETAGQRERIAELETLLAISRSGRGSLNNLKGAAAARSRRLASDLAGRGTSKLTRQRKDPGDERGSR